MREQFLATDPEVFVAEVEGFGTGGQVRAALSSISAPALFVVRAGEDPEDGATEVGGALPIRPAPTLPGVGHIGAFPASGSSRTLARCWAKVSPRALRPARGAGRIVTPSD